MTRTEILACLNDRPCDVCKYHTESGCKRWNCVFEEEPDEDKIKHFDGMTNGEVIQVLFPNPHIEIMSHTVWVGHDAMSFTRKWWNAPYKAEKGGE